MGRRQQSRRVGRKSILRMRRKPHGLRVERGRTLENERMGLGTTTVLSGESSVLSSALWWYELVVAHVNVEATVARFLREKVLARDKIARCTCANSQPRQKGGQYDFCNYSALVIIYGQNMCFAISFLSQDLLVLKAHSIMGLMRESLISSAMTTSIPVRSTSCSIACGFLASIIREDSQDQ